MITPSFPAAPGLMEYAGGAALATLIGLTLSLWHRFNEFRIQQDARHSQNVESTKEIKTALAGYNGAGGGLLEVVDRLNRESATVDARITETRHKLRGEMQVSLGKLEMSLLERMDQFERRVNQRLDDLKREAR